MDPQYLLERMSLKKSISRWRLVTLLLIGISIGLIFKKNHTLSVTPYIAKVKITGIIENNDTSIKNLEKLANNNAVKAVIIDIDSGGGSAVGGEKYYNAIKQISKKKPVVALLEQVTASAAYMTAMACDHIVSHEFTLTGSIGAIIQTYEVTELAKKLGINFISIKSSPLKAMPNHFEKYTPEAAEVERKLIKDAGESFSKMVKYSRKLNNEELNSVNNGKIFSSRQALRLKLIDSIGNEKTAIEWLVKKRKISKDLNVKLHLLSPKPSKLDKFLNSIHYTAQFLNQFNLSNYSPKLS